VTPPFIGDLLIKSKLKKTSNRRLLVTFWIGYLGFLGIEFRPTFWSCCYRIWISCRRTFRFSFVWRCLFPIFQFSFLAQWWTAWNCGFVILLKIEKRTCMKLYQNSWCSSLIWWESNTDFFTQSFFSTSLDNKKIKISFHVLADAVLRRPWTETKNSFHVCL